MVVIAMVVIAMVAIVLVVIETVVAMFVMLVMAVHFQCFCGIFQSSEHVCIRCCA